MSRLSRISLANRGLVALIAVIVTVFGLLIIPKLKQQLFPSLDFPAAFVVAPYAGAGPEIVERQVTIPIENAVKGIDGLETVNSTSREGAATIQLSFRFGTDLDAAVAKVQSSLNRIDAQLPQGVDPQVVAGSTDDFPVVVLAASSSGDQRALADKLRTAVVPEIVGVEGVRDATITGVRDQQIVITPSLPKMAAAGVDVAAISTALRSNGVALPAGTLTEGSRSLTVQVGTPLSSVDDLKALYLTPAAGGRAPVRLGDIATVALQDAPVTSLTRTNGKPSLGISVTATPDGNAVGISNQIKDKIPALTKALGGEVAVTPVFDQAPFVERSIDGLTTEGLLGLVMAVLVILFFLLSVRSTLVTAVSIPLSVIVALIGLQIFDYSLNVLTLGALTIAIGRVVDDSIVVLENIKRHLGYGEERGDAIRTAVKEVAGAVTASTLTTVAVFSPIALVGGFVGQLFAPFAVTVTVALLASLLVSLTLIPVLAFWFLKPATGGSDVDDIRRAAEEKELNSRLQRAYIPVIRFATTRRVLTLSIAVVIFFVTIGLGALLKTNFFDQSGQTALSITQTLPVGTSLPTTDAAAHLVETVLADTAGVKTYQVTMGSGGGVFGIGGTATNVATFSVTIDDGADVIALQDALRAKLDALSNVGQIEVDAGGGGGFSQTQLQVIVESDDPAALQTAAEQVRATMAGTPDVADVSSDLANSSPRIDIAVNRQAAARYGLTEAGIGQMVAAATTTELKNRLTALTLPAGATYQLGGVSADQSDAFGDLGLALLAAVAIVFLVMAATFRSLIQPLILLVSIPFAATGAIILLLLTGTALGVPALIGMLMLIGIVVTNAIVLMDLINQYRSAGLTVREAVVEGGRRRLRPILMTAVATIFALLPMALGLTGSGGFISKPLAVVVIGGLLSSTVLTLVLVPTLYTMVEDRRERRRLRKAGTVELPAEPVDEPEPVGAAVT